MPLLKSRYKILRRFDCDFPSLVSNFNKKPLLKKKSKFLVKKLSFSKVFYEKFKSKQQVKFNYLLTEKKLKFCIKKAFGMNKINKKGIILNLYNILEFSLDYVLTKLGLATTILSAKQIINHRNVFVNGNICCQPKYTCLVGDSIEVKNKIDWGVNNNIDLNNNYILQDNKIVVNKYHIDVSSFMKNLLIKTIEYY